MDVQGLRDIVKDGKEATLKLYFDKWRWMDRLYDFRASLTNMSRSELRKRRDELYEAGCIDIDEHYSFRFRKRTMNEKMEIECITRLLKQGYISEQMNIDLDGIALYETSGAMSYSWGYLIVGECYEEGVAAFLRSLGVEAIRYDEDVPEGQYRQLQRDIGVRDITGQKLNIELKALKGGSYSDAGILVGCCPKWDKKLFDVHAVVVVHQQTGLILWTEASKAAQKQWKLFYGQKDDSYLVPTHCWKPLDSLVTSLGYML